MPAFNLEHEQRRLGESGLSFNQKVSSTKDSLRTLIAERTQAPSYFSLTAAEGRVNAVGYAQRGEINTSFKKSVEEAPTDTIGKRYELENKGYKEVEKKFFELPLYSTILLFSPPPEIPIDGYTGQSMAYFYHILPGKREGTRDIKAVSWVNDFSKTEQIDILKKCEPQKNIEATEESILTSPVSASRGFTGNTETFQRLWQEVQNVYKKKERDFQCLPVQVMEEYLLRGEEYMKNNYPVLDVMMEEVAKRLSEGATQKNIAEVFNIMLNQGDKDVLYKNISHQKSYEEVPGYERQLRLPQAAVLFEQNRHMAHNVRKIETPCGISGGMTAPIFGVTARKENSLITTSSFTVTSPLKASFLESSKILCCTCPFCKKQVEAVIEGGTISCPSCSKKADYSDEGTTGE